VFEQAYGAVLVIVACSIILGRAICVRCGGPGRWSAAPFVGFAALMALANASIKLPGRADTAVAICAVAVVVSLAYLVWQARLARLSWRTRLVRPGGDLLIGLIALFAASIPFIAQGRVGPGALVDNDMSNHLIWAEALRSAQYSKIYSLLTSEGYPLGPHALVAVVGTATGAQLIWVFGALLVSVMVLTAIVAGDVLRSEGIWRRAVVGVISGTAYLVAAYYGEGSFKETIMAGLVLAFALHLGQLRASWTAASHRTRFAMVLPAAVLLTGAIYTYSYLGIVWFGATIVAWAVVEIAARPTLARAILARRNLEVAAPWALALVAFEVVVLAPIAPELSQFFGGFGFSPAGTAAFTTGILGNLPHPLSVYEALGIWPSGDFRQLPISQFDSGELGALALAVLVFGVVWSVRRGRCWQRGSGARWCGCTPMRRSHRT
jgi:hypothetical protein